MPITRREFLEVSVISLSGILVAACGVRLTSPTEGVLPEPEPTLKTYLPLTTAYLDGEPYVLYTQSRDTLASIENKVDSALNTIPDPEKRGTVPLSGLGMSESLMTDTLKLAKYEIWKTDEGYSTIITFDDKHHVTSKVAFLNNQLILVIPETREEVDSRRYSRVVFSPETLHGYQITSFEPKGKAAFDFRNIMTVYAIGNGGPTPIPVIGCREFLENLVNSNTKIAQIDSEPLNHPEFYDALTSILSVISRPGGWIRGSGELQLVPSIDNDAKPEQVSVPDIGSDYTNTYTNSIDSQTRIATGKFREIFEDTLMEIPSERFKSLVLNEISSDGSRKRTRIVTLGNAGVDTVYTKTVFAEDEEPEIKLTGTALSNLDSPNKDTLSQIFPKNVIEEIYENKDWSLNHIEWGPDSGIYWSTNGNELVSGLRFKSTVDGHKKDEIIIMKENGTEKTTSEWNAELFGDLTEIAIEAKRNGLDYLGPGAMEPRIWFGKLLEIASSEPKAERIRNARHLAILLSGQEEQVRILEGKIIKADSQNDVLPPLTTQFLIPYERIREWTTPEGEKQTYIILGKDGSTEGASVIQKTYELAVRADNLVLIENPKGIKNALRVLMEILAAPSDPEAIDFYKDNGLSGSLTQDEINKRALALSQAILNS